MMMMMPPLLMMKVYKQSDHDWSESYVINFLGGEVKILSDTAMPFSHTPRNMARFNSHPLLQHHHSFSGIVSRKVRLGPFGVK